jgi:predicted acylesterase/phospholipase RssA
LKEIQTLLLGGGGAKVLGYIGVLKFLEENSEIKLNLKHVCGVSAGAFFGLLMIIGFQTDIMEQIIIKKDFNTLKNVKFTNFFSGWGLDSGDKITEWFQSFLILKDISKDVTFKQLYDIFPTKLTILSTNLNTQEFTHFNFLETPSVKVIDALRLSISVPFIFTPKKWKNCIHVDGAIVNNYPIHLFSNIELETFLGIKTTSSFEKSDLTIDTFENYIYNIINCFIYKRKKIWNDTPQFPNTIEINNSNNTVAIDFNMTESKKQDIIQIGYNCSKLYFGSSTNLE